MAVNRRRTNNNIAYGTPNGLQSLAPQPIIAQRNPTSSDTGPVGVLWCNANNNTYYVLTSVSAGTANWQAQGDFTGTFVSVDISGSGTALNVTTGSASIGGNLQVTGDATINGIGILAGAGDPNGTINAAQGSMYLRTDGSSASTRMYINTTGAAVWTNVVTAA